MPNLDAALYRWIFQANEKRDDLGLPPGFIEESIALIKRVLLEQLLIVESGPIPVMDDDAHPLRKWLLSAHIFQHPSCEQSALRCRMDWGFSIYPARGAHFGLTAIYYVLHSILQ